ncbi:MAG TPA: hypothetical protein VHZ25_00325 [Acidobacteriaceae bacterium]|jgi:hypothetical protein|nr:hypothetical protein [Acidobacteriaceae bacterium]
MRALASLLLLCIATAAYSQEEQSLPILSGYVTRLASDSDFDVNGVRVLCNNDTKTEQPSGDSYHPGCPDQPYIGLALDVYGHNRKKLHAIVADRINLKAHRLGDVSGYAVIDAVTAGTAAGSLQFRTDGYTLLIDPKTAITFNPPLRSLADVMANVWVNYQAKRRPNGVFVAQAAKFSQNFVTDREEDMRGKNDYDPSAVSPGAKQNPVAIAVGAPPDPRKIPPWPNHAMQDRLTSIGEKLIPSYQQHLAASDPSRIDFRFQLTDGKRWPAILTLPNGIVLVPHQVVERMQNDSQLAEVLADAIACVLEKQTYRMRAASTAITTGNVISWAQFLPVVGGPAALVGIGAGASQAIAMRKEEHQSARVSLGLLRDAGYDVDQAPLAWWLLASRKPRPLNRIDMPDRTSYLYRTLGDLWRSPAP